MLLNELFEPLLENAVRIGGKYIRLLKGKSQLLNLLKQSPLGALRGWVCEDGSVWVWDAMDWSHGWASRHIPGHQHPVYFWNHSAPSEEFEQNGGKETAIDCGDFLFDVGPFNREADRKIVLARSPLLARLISTI